MSLILLWRRDTVGEEVQCKCLWREYALHGAAVTKLAEM